MVALRFFLMSDVKHIVFYFEVTAVRKRFYLFFFKHGSEEALVVLIKNKPSASAFS